MLERVELLLGAIHHGRKPGAGVESGVAGQRGEVKHRDNGLLNGEDLLLAGLESIPKQPLEAARVDGAPPWYVFWRVILPLLRPVLAVAVLLRALDAMKVFEYVYATTKGGPGTETQTLQYFTYQTGVQFFRLGSAASMAFVVLAVVLTAVVLTFRLLERNRDA
ncbi:sugar ABC transporter permease [Mycobacterium sp. ELW1]|nr:sugar ABC transporter permease [Mycobacterium sp. ELW1]